MSYIIKQLDVQDKDWFFDFFHELCNKFDHHDSFYSLEDINIENGVYKDTEVKICVAGKATFEIDGNIIPIKEGTYVEIEKDVPFNFTFHREDWESGLNLLRFFNSTSLQEEGVRF